jgi:hypothetical protein
VSLKLPSAALYVVKLTFADVFESHSLRQFLNHSQKCGFRELVTIFERFLLPKSREIPCFAVLRFRGNFMANRTATVVSQFESSRRIALVTMSKPARKSITRRIREEMSPCAPSRNCARHTKKAERDKSNVDD